MILGHSPKDIVKDNAKRGSFDLWQGMQKTVDAAKHHESQQNISSAFLPDGYELLQNW